HPDRVGALPASTPMTRTARVTQHAAPSAATPPPPAPGRSHPTATEPGPPDPANARGPVSPHAHEPYGTRRTSHAATAPQAPHTPSSTTPSSPGPASPHPSRRSARAAHPPATTRSTPRQAHRTRPATNRPPRPAHHATTPPQPSDQESQSRSEEHTSELQSRENLVCRLLLEKKNTRGDEGR